MGAGSRLLLLGRSRAGLVRATEERRPTSPATGRRLASHQPSDRRTLQPRSAALVAMGRDRRLPRRLDAWAERLSRSTSTGNRQSCGLVPALALWRLLPCTTCMAQRPCSTIRAWPCSERQAGLYRSGGHNVAQRAALRVDRQAHRHRSFYETVRAETACAANRRLRRCARLGCLNIPLCKIDGTGIPVAKPIKLGQRSACSAYDGFDCSNFSSFALTLGGIQVRRSSSRSLCGRCSAERATHCGGAQARLQYKSHGSAAPTQQSQ